MRDAEKMVAQVSQIQNLRDSILASLVRLQEEEAVRDLVEGARDYEVEDLVRALKDADDALGFYFG